MKRVIISAIILVMILVTFGGCLVRMDVDERGGRGKGHEVDRGHEGDRGHDRDGGHDSRQRHEERR